MNIVLIIIKILGLYYSIILIIFVPLIIIERERDKKEISYKEDPLFTESMLELEEYLHTGG